jgi:hypothetical protein
MLSTPPASWMSCLNELTPWPTPSRENVLRRSGGLMSASWVSCLEETAPEPNPPAQDAQLHSAVTSSTTPVTSASRLQLDSGATPSKAHASWIYRLEAVAPDLTLPIEDIKSYMVPPINLDSSFVHPKVADCLQDYIARYIHHNRTQQSSEADQDVDDATRDILRYFQFNHDNRYDATAYERALWVRTNYPLPAT